jgi:hypothetical protein
MSALDQKQTCAPQKAMSALPLIATAKANSRKRSCLLYPRKRTCAVQLQMSAKGQKRTSMAWLQRYPVGHSHQLHHVPHPQFLHHTAAVQLDCFLTNSEDECGLFV